jgi:hypothetical protein
MQGDSRLVDITAGGDLLGLCDQKSSYKHVSDFGRLRSYGHVLNPVRALVCTASEGTSRRVMYSVAYGLRCKQNFCHLTRPASYRQSSSYISTLGRYFRNAGKVGWTGVWVLA